MGTRSLTRVKETFVCSETQKTITRTLVCMYRQYDGYPNGHGLELAEFLNSGKMVNGISMAEKEKVFNGSGCLAAQMVSHFKGDSAGGFYLEPVNAKDCGQEYEYEVIYDWNGKELSLVCKEVGYVNKQDKYVNKKRVIFKGKVEDFIKKYESVEA